MEEYKKWNPEEGPKGFFTGQKRNTKRNRSFTAKRMKEIIQNMKTKEKRKRDKKERNKELEKKLNDLTIEQLRNFIDEESSKENSINEKIILEAAKKISEINKYIAENLKDEHIEDTKKTLTVKRISILKKHKKKEEARKQEEIKKREEKRKKTRRKSLFERRNSIWNLFSTVSKDL